MGDRAAERRLLRPLGVDVDVVVIVGEVREAIDPLLGHLLPVGVAEVAAERFAQPGHVGGQSSCHLFSMFGLRGI